MIAITEQNGNTEYGVMSFTADTEAEVASLPTTCAVGSTVYVIAEKKIYILNGGKTWVEM